MNDNQNLANTGGSQLSQTQNPQTIGGQSLVQGNDNLQSSPSSALSTTGTFITSVGSSQFQLIGTQSVAVPTIKQPNAPLLSWSFIVGTVVVVFIFIGIIVIVFRNGQKPIDT